MKLNPSHPMKLTSFTSLAFILNRLIDRAPDTDLSCHEIFDAAADHRLISLLADRYGRIPFTWVTDPNKGCLPQMEAALGDAAAAYEGRVGSPTGPLSDLCLAMDIVLKPFSDSSTGRHPAK